MPILIETILSWVTVDQKGDKLWRHKLPERLNKIIWYVRCVLDLKDKLMVTTSDLDGDLSEANSCV